MNGSHQAAGKAALQTVLQLVNVRWRTITGHDDVFLLIEKLIEGIENFHLGGILGAEELHIVDEEEIQIPVLGPELGHGVVLDGIDELVGEGFAGNEEYRQAGLISMDIVADGMKQMGLPQS